jgi:hypothetical protein
MPLGGAFDLVQRRLDDPARKRRAGDSRGGISPPFHQMDKHIF